ncbi:PTS transporter subunit IIC [Candidatus Cetobacterium colombiensis]|uniref:PTS sugar transporter subunit IIC n=1 Tax=Candidatus Cetobacterium colombiensis TaxID=3073100 RepID=A0ABU4WAT2_9FUSO|nr:PTS sugar transporter subunit IIC [Candidatus Cetobacterium colombiensis]MDX8336641.1 PTS sugar transporter subunit IIC [Candidatus Cetobacterium colombiensis]
MKIRDFLKGKDVHLSGRKYFVDALGAMALGMFSTLITGSILNMIGQRLGVDFLTSTVWPIARDMTGAAIGVAIAYSLKAPPLVLFSSTFTGAIGYSLGGPVGAYVSALIGAEFGKIVSKETKIDIVLTPVVTIIIGGIVGTSIGPILGKIMTGIGFVVMEATELHPFFMGILISIFMGMALTLPISSAAIAMMLKLEGLAAGAATLGCCTQMVGFAVTSFKENGWGGLVAQGLGTSMLQFSNIVKNWKIWIPQILASIILSPLVTIVFKMENSFAGAGMGTSGLVGIFESYVTMEKIGRGGIETVILIVFLYILLPGVITYTISLFMRRKGFINDHDMRIES